MDMFLQPNCLNACDFRARKDRLVDLLKDPSEPEGGGARGQGETPLRYFGKNISRTFSFKRPWITTCKTPSPFLDLPTALILSGKSENCPLSLS